MWQWWNTGRAGLSFRSPFPTIFSTNLGFILHNQLIDKSKLDASFKPTCAESTERGENTGSKTWNKAGLNLPRPRPRLAIAMAAFHPADVAQQASGLRQPTRDAKHISTFIKSNNYLYVCGFFFFHLQVLSNANAGKKHKNMIIMMACSVYSQSWSGLAPWRLVSFKYPAIFILFFLH